MIKSVNFVGKISEDWGRMGNPRRGIVPGVITIQAGDEIYDIDFENVCVSVVNDDFFISAEKPTADSDASRVTRRILKNCEVKDFEMFLDDDLPKDLIKDVFSVSFDLSNKLNKSDTYFMETDQLHSIKNLIKIHSKL